MNKELANVNPLSERARGDVCVFLQRAGMYICNREEEAPRRKAMHREAAIVTHFDLSRIASFQSAAELDSRHPTTKGRQRLFLSPLHARSFSVRVTCGEGNG